MKLRVLSESDIAGVIDKPQDLLAVMAETFASYSAGRSVVPPRVELPLEGAGTAFVMPAFQFGAEELGLKFGIWSPSTAAGDRPAVIVNISTAPGGDVGLVDARGLTGFRTALASAVSVVHLARPSSRCMSIFGYGRQAWSHARLIPQFIPLDSIVVSGPSNEKAENFADGLREDLDGVVPDIRVAASSDAAVREADLIVTATSSGEPVFDGASLKPGTHICAVGSFEPTSREVAVQDISDLRVFADSRYNCAHRAGEFLIPQGGDPCAASTWIDGELGEVIEGGVEGRQSDTQITLFKSLGLGLQDVALAAALLKAAESQGRGTSVEL